jgi:hypothetical protein
VTGPSFGSDEVRLGAALHRCVAHVDACSELYGRGRKADALLHAARPITDVLPWIEQELRSRPEPFRAFTSAASAAGAAVRRNVKPRKLRKIAAAMEASVDELVTAVAGNDGSTPEFRASVAVALLMSTDSVYKRAVKTHSLGDYQAAHALSARALELLDVGANGSSELRGHLASLRIVLPSLEPPKHLASPTTVTEIVQSIATACEADLGAIAPHDRTLDESLAKLDRLIDDVVVTYTDGTPALSARLAASLYVRSYVSIREQLSAANDRIARRLEDLLAVDLRRSINDGASPEEVAALGAEGRRLIHSIRLDESKAHGIA